MEDSKRIRLQTRADLTKSYPRLVSMLRKPQLAADVRELLLDRLPSAWRIEPGSREYEFEEETEVDEENDRLVAEAISQIGFSDEKADDMRKSITWKRKNLKMARKAIEDDEFFYINYERDWDTMYAFAVAVLFLSICPIEKLVISGWGGQLQNFIHAANYNRLSKPHLDNLRCYRFMCTGDDLFDTDTVTEIPILEELTHVHRLPAIESFTLNGVAQPVGLDLSDALSPHTSNIKKIAMLHVDISSRYLSPIIRLPKALDVFILSVGGLILFRGSYARILAKTLGKSLLCQRKTLRVLDLDIDEYLSAYDYNRGEFGSDKQREEEEEASLEAMPEDWKIDQRESPGPLWLWQLADTRPYGLTIGSLFDFEALTHLSIGIKLLLGVNDQNEDRYQKEPPFRLVDALPSSLEYLCIRGYKAGESLVYDSHVQELMELKSDKLPKLSTVEGVDNEIPSALIYTDSNIDTSLLWKETKTVEGLVEGLECYD